MAGSREAIVTALGLDGTNREMPIPGERRSDYRRLVDLAAVWESSESAEDCRVVDITDNGAQIALADDQNAPDRFTLYIAEINARLDCRVRWRTENRLGVMFSPVEA